MKILPHKQVLLFCEFPGSSLHHCATLWRGESQVTNKKKKLASYATYMCFKIAPLSTQFLSCSELPLWWTDGCFDKEIGWGLERLYRLAGSLKFWFMRKNKSFLYLHTQTETQRPYLSMKRASRILTCLIKRHLILKYQITGVWLLIAV